MEYKLKQNMFYQICYQLLLLLTPLIVSPYISRVLGVNNLGIYSYTNSMVSYFSLFAQLGISNHGSRSISKVRHDKTERNKVFWNIYILQVTATLLSVMAFGIFCLCSHVEYKIILIVQALVFIANLLDISWYFYGMEYFKITVACGCIVKIASVIAVLLLVKGEGSLLSYTAIMALTPVASAVILWISVGKTIGIPHIDIGQIKKNIYPVFILFIPVMASGVYHIIDKTMLGSMSTYQELGYYYNADKGINIPIGVFTGISTVMLPFLSRKTHNAEIVLEDSFKINFVIVIAMAFGIYAVSEEFVPVFFGKGYDKCIILVKLFIPVLFIKVLSMFTRMQIIVPRSKDKIYVYAVLCGAAVNIFANAFLIKIYGSVGAVIGTFIAEFVVCMIQCMKTGKEFDYKENILKNRAYIMIGFIMILVIKGIKIINCSLILKLVIEILAGGGIYLFLCYQLWKKNNL